MLDEWSIWSRDEDVAQKIVPYSKQPMQRTRSEEGEKECEHKEDEGEKEGQANIIIDKQQLVAGHAKQVDGHAATD